MVPRRMRFSIRRARVAKSFMVQIVAMRVDYFTMNSLCWDELQVADEMTTYFLLEIVRLWLA